MCDRCGHAADEANIHSGYRLFGLLRFRAGPESAFGEFHYVEGDLCDACLFTLLGHYVRATDTDLHRCIETSGHTEVPRAAGAALWPAFFGFWVIGTVLPRPACGLFGRGADPLETPSEKIRLNGNGWYAGGSWKAIRPAGPGLDLSPIRVPYPYLPTYDDTASAWQPVIGGVRCNRPM